MSKPGYNNNNSQGSSGQKLKIGPASAPAAKPPGALKKILSSLATPFTFARDHKRGLGFSLAGLFIAASAMQSEREHPQHSLASFPGAMYAAKRVGQNISTIVGGAWGVASAIGGPVLEETGMVGTGTQPSTRFIVCTNKTLYDAMLAKNPRATAYAEAVQTELDSQAYWQLAVKDGPFYTRNAHIDPDTRAPVAIFRLTPAFGLDEQGLPSSWNPNLPVNLGMPDAVAQKNAGPAACAQGEVFRWSPVPGMK